VVGVAPFVLGQVLVETEPANTTTQYFTAVPYVCAAWIPTAKSP
jgi:hypothetical protein